MICLRHANAWQMTEQRAGRQIYLSAKQAVVRSPTVGKHRDSWIKSSKDDIAELVPRKVKNNGKHRSTSNEKRIL